MLHFAQALEFEVEHMGDERATVRIVMNLNPRATHDVRPGSAMRLPAAHGVATA
jgi:hypothetical protein